MIGVGLAARSIVAAPLLFDWGRSMSERRDQKRARAAARRRKLEDRKRRQIAKNKRVKTPPKSRGQGVDRACLGKATYGTREAAESDLPRSQKAYLCPHCDMFHRATLLVPKEHYVPGKWDHTAE